MVDKPEGSIQGHEAEKKESSRALVASTSATDVPAANSEEQEKHAHYAGQYTRYVMRPFVAIWRFLIRPVGQFLDRHHASVTAVATIAIMVLTFYYAKYSRKQWVTMQQQLELANRPSVGVDTIDVRYRGVNKEGNGLLNSNYFNQARDMDFYVSIKNFGPVPAENYLATWRILVGGAEQPVDKRALPAPIFPGNVKKLVGHVGENGFPDVVHRTKLLVLEITIRYEGPVANQHYEYCQREEFAPYVNGFIDLGPTCGHKTQ